MGVELAVMETAGGADGKGESERETGADCRV